MKCLSASCSDIVSFFFLNDHTLEFSSKTPLTQILYISRRYNMKANGSKATSDAFECKSEMYLSFRNFIL